MESFEILNNVKHPSLNIYNLLIQNSLFLLYIYLIICNFYCLMFSKNWFKQYFAFCFIIHLLNTTSLCVKFLCTPLEAEDTRWNIRPSGKSWCVNGKRRKGKKERKRERERERERERDGNGKVSWLKLLRSRRCFQLSQIYLKWALRSTSI